MSCPIFTLEGKVLRIPSLCLPLSSVKMSPWFSFVSSLFLVLILRLVCLCFVQTSHTERNCFAWFNASCCRHAALLHQNCNLTIDVIDVPRGFCAWSSQQQRSLWQVLCQKQGVKKFILISHKKPADIVKYMINIMKRCNYACRRAKIV